MEKYNRGGGSTSSVRNNDKKLSTGSKTAPRKETKEKIETKIDMKVEVKSESRQETLETSSPHGSNPSTPRNINANSVNYSSPGGSGNPFTTQDGVGREKSDSHNLSFEQQNLLNISNESSNVSQEASSKEKTRSHKKENHPGKSTGISRSITSSNKSQGSAIRTGMLLSKASTSIPVSSTQKGEKAGRGLIGNANQTAGAGTNAAAQAPTKRETGLLDIATFYKKEKGKINTWTYYFRNLNSAITDIHAMCEKENKKEYCDGVIATLENSLNHFRKLRHKFEVETQFSANQRSVAWELPSYNLSNNSDLQNNTDVENFIEDLEDAENVDFTLLSQLINEGRMTFDEAIVFLIRERALAIEEGVGTASGGITNILLSNNNSFISKYSTEFLEAIKEFKDDSNILDSNSQNEKEIHKRSRSVTPTSLSLVRIIKRLNWRLSKRMEIKEEDDEVEESNKEKLILDKQQKAEILRKYHEESKRDFGLKIQERLKMAKERLEEKKRRQLFTAINKRDQAEQRYLLRIKEIKQRAKEESNKANEIAFIAMLDNKDKRLTLDEKLNEVCERKLQIIETIKQKQNVKALVRGEAVEKRRKENLKAQQEKTKISQQRREEAEIRRAKFLEEKKKQQLESKKEKTITEKKKAVTNLNKSALIFPKDEFPRKSIDSRPYKQKLFKLKQRFLKDKERMDQIFHQVGINSKAQTSDFNEASSFKTVKTTDSESNFTDDEEERPNLKMNSVDNSVDYTVMIEGNYSSENSIIYENNANKGTNEEGGKEKEDFSKNGGEKFLKKRKKGKVSLKERNGKGGALNMEEKNFSEKRKRFLDLPSSSLPILRYQSSLCLLKAKGTRKIVKNLHVKLRRKYILKKPSKKFLISKEKDAPRETDLPKEQPPQSRKGSDQVEKLEKQDCKDTNGEQLAPSQQAGELGKPVEQMKPPVEGASSVLKPTESKQQSKSENEKSVKKSDANKKASNKLANPSFGTVKGSRTSKLGSSFGGTKVSGPTANAGDFGEKKEAAVGEDDSKNEDPKLLVNASENGPASEKEGESSVIKWCSICNMIVQEEPGSEDHLQSKTHKKIKSLYSLTNNDDLNCILTFQTGDPENEDLKNQRLNAFKKRCRKIKQRLSVASLKHEAAPVKDTSSPNKQRLQKLCVDLEKQISPQIKDYNQVENTLRDLIKILEVRREADLHIMRNLKFLPSIIEICKRVTVVHKNDINSLMRVWELTIKVLLLFCGLTDNRTFMITTNRILPLIDLLKWCLNQPTKYVYSLVFIPNLFQLLTMHLKHRLSPEFCVMRDDVIEYIFCSGFILKLKQKFMSFDEGLDLSTAMGKVPLALLKSVTFLETLTGYSGFDFRDKPVYEKSSVSESILFVIKETELVGVIPLLASLLLSDPAYGKPPFKNLPQTVLSLGIICLKFLNNMAQLDLEILQRVLNAKHNEDIVFHILSFLLSYSSERFGEIEDVEDLLNEALLLIGYYCLLNKTSQSLMSRGEQTLVQKLSALPFNYFCDKKKLQECLFPTLICVVFKNERNLKILLQEVDPSMLIGFISAQTAMYPYPKNGDLLVENISQAPCQGADQLTPRAELSAQPQLNQSSRAEEKPTSAAPEEQKAQESEGVYSNYLNLVKESREKKGRSLSISSTTSSQKSFVGTQPQSFKFIMRFPRELWEEAIQFLKS